MLVNDSPQSFEKMIDLASDEKSLFVDTENCDEPHEYKYLLDNIQKFSQSDNEIMLAKFSGKESIVRDLGDTCPEMIISLSSDKNSRHYTQHPVDMFLDLMTIFKKETN